MDDLENVDKETLISLLKEKSKEIKTNKAKLEKIEERYVKIFKENKALTKDRDTFEKFFKSVFEAKQDKFTNVELGAYDFDSISEIWNSREEEKFKLHSDTVETYKKERIELESKIKALKDEVISASNQIKPDIEKQLNNSKNRIDSMEKANENLTREIKELNELIELKNKEIERLKKLEYELGSLKAEILMKDLQLKNMNDNLNLKSKMEENERKNTILKLKHDLEAATDKIKELETERVEKELDRIKKQRHTATQVTLLEELIQEEQKNASNGSEAAIILAEVQAANLNGKDTGTSNLNNEYLKNVILKYFCYSEGGNEKEAGLLMHAICTILKMTPIEREMIDEAKQNKSIWNSAVNFFREKFNTKGDVNYYTNRMSQG